MKFRKMIRMTTAFALFFCTALTDAGQCKNKRPQIINPLVDWAIIASNTAIIPLKNAFSGKNLVFSLTTKPEIVKNNVSINASTGEIHLKAVKKESFDIIVNAKNPCGSSSTRFNVTIDEELF